MEQVEDVRIEVRRGAIWITLNRPQALNALSPNVVARINQALDQAEADDRVKAVVLTGTGKAFCAGGDLRYIHAQIGQDRAQVARFLESVLAMMARLERCPRPVIAAINGIAVAGGLELVLCCDLVIAARSAKLGDGHGNFGLLPGGGATVRLPRKIGPTRAKYLLFSGESLSAEEMMASGLVNKVVDDDKLLEETGLLVDKLQGKSTLALRRMKVLVDEGLEQPRDVALRNELVMSELHAHSHDMKEGLQAFLEKRPPVFTGR
ncbi:MAG TPA: enoyl-CoA hydratase/isomerase family protein [Rhizomicrobium sp.]|nr:enoyl-CoA hydratase/isomerase family protein [Rhizomicrobium sp.]